LALNEFTKLSIMLMGKLNDIKLAWWSSAILKLKGRIFMRHLLRSPK